MRIEKYNLMLDPSYKPILQREFARNISCVGDLHTPKRIVDVMNDIFALEDCAEEHVYMIALNQRCKPLGFFEISHGTVNATPANPREILIRALLCGATGIVMVHNHPSGNPTPSEEDMDLTRHLKHATQMVGLELLDHIIIGREGYVSLEEEK